LRVVLRAAFFAVFFVAFLGAFFVVRFATFFVAFFAVDFFVAFFVAFFAVDFFAAFFVAFFVAFFAVDFFAAFLVAFFAVDFFAAFFVAFLPFAPPSRLLTVAHAMRSAASVERPSFFSDASMCAACRRCLGEYEDLSPRGMTVASWVAWPLFRTAGVASS
jgi:hypothetical protein